MRLPYVLYTTLLPIALAYPAPTDSQASSSSYLGKPGDATFDYVSPLMKVNDTY